MTTSTTILYGIPNCDTVKKARAWLDANGVAYRFHDFKREGVPAAGLTRWLREAGRDTLVNRKGAMWRKLSDGQRDAVVDDASAARLLTEQPSVIKRPVVEWADGRLSVGFDAASWAAALK
jgi:Spx/MgsR family transcriptional regulator